MMMGDRFMALPFLDKNTLYEETMRDKKRNIQSGVVYADTVSIGSCEVFPDKDEMLLSIDASWDACLSKNHDGTTQQILTPFQ